MTRETEEMLIEVAKAVVNGRLWPHISDVAEKALARVTEEKVKPKPMDQGDMGLTHEERGRIVRKAAHSVAYRFRKSGDTREARYQWGCAAINEAVDEVLNAIDRARGAGS